MSKKLIDKFTAYSGYMVPTVTYATKVLFDNKTETKEIEIPLPLEATSWILSNWELRYRKKLVDLNLLPLSLNREIIDSLFLIAVRTGKYNIGFSISKNQKCGY